jgi:hypothetical protein
MGSLFFWMWLKTFNSLNDIVSFFFGYFVYLYVKLWFVFATDQLGPLIRVVSGFSGGIKVIGVSS